ncbi:MAG: hypothetical protein J6R45_02470 [Clostridia bacterium]|nr:hypothetical protein [Clostridia bacterium]MBO5786166.1 hypothetical protein [Clostridia bacterium]
MDNFVIAIILLVLVFVFTAASGVLISSLCDRIIGLCDSGSVKEALSLWNEYKNAVSFFVRDSEIDTADTFASKFESGDASALPRFIESISEIKATERFGFLNLF